ncbi:putative protein phosphatase 2C family [Helianthus annuus]|nr:putative protein phosphatase 2C family [Helianthus annuus]KAJ0932014.1 putative protein phosphatase 2C family [Helianthus annuus]
MVQFSSFLSGLTKNISPKKGKKRRINLGREATEALAKESWKNGLLLTSSGNVCAEWSSNYISAYSKCGNKGTKSLTKIPSSYGRDLEGRNM